MSAAPLIMDEWLHSIYVGRPVSGLVIMRFHDDEALSVRVCMAGLVRYGSDGFVVLLENHIIPECFKMGDALLCMRHWATIYWRCFEWHIAIRGPWSCFSRIFFVVVENNIENIKSVKLTDGLTSNNSCLTDSNDIDQQFRTVKNTDRSAHTLCS